MDMKPIRPFEPISTDTLPLGKDWVSQVKWDGTRVLTYYDGLHTRLYNRRLNEKTLQYPELTDFKSYCKAESVILDGEIIALEGGKPSFYKVMKRDQLKNQQKIQIAKAEIPIIYMVFDILFFNGDWVMDKPLQERQQLLDKIITQHPSIQLVRNHHDSKALFHAVVEHELEGIVVKDLKSKYLMNGKDKRWQKKKVLKDLDAVVGGVTYRYDIVNALLLGLYDEGGQLWYIGHAGTGKLTQRDWRSITDFVHKIKVQECPFINVPERNKGAVWMKPELTVKVRFMDWTQARTLRQPSIQSFVNRSVKECTFGQT